MEQAERKVTVLCLGLKRPDEVSTWPPIMLLSSSFFSLGPKPTQVGKSPADLQTSSEKRR